MLTDSLYILLANHQEAAMQAQGAHWNVEGPNFKEYHQFFSEIYEDWYSQVDRLAEYIRITSVSQVYVNSSLNAFASKKTFSSASTTESDPLVLVESLSKTLSVLRGGYLSLKQEATDYPGLMNYLDERLDVVDKQQWMLKASGK